jgi:hypothetical protein
VLMSGSLVLLWDCILNCQLQSQSALLDCCFDRFKVEYSDKCLTVDQIYESSMLRSVERADILLLLICNVLPHRRGETKGKSWGVMS